MNVLVVYCHPDPASFVASVRDRVVSAVERPGRVTRVTDLYADGFDPCFDAHDRRTHLDPGVTPALQRYADDLRWCETLVLVYPTWWSGQPAMLKGWIDRVWANGVAWTLPSGASRVQPLLTKRPPHRRGHHTWIVETRQLAPGRRGQAGRHPALRSLCSRRCRGTWVAMYGVDTSSADERDKFLDRAERRLAKL